MDAKPDTPVQLDDISVTHKVLNTTIQLTNFSSLQTSVIHGNLLNAICLEGFISSSILTNEDTQLCASLITHFTQPIRVGR